MGILAKHPNNEALGLKPQYLGTDTKGDGSLLYYVGTLDSFWFYSTAAQMLRAGNERHAGITWRPKYRGFEYLDSSQMVHVGIWYILKAQRGSHIPTLRPKYLPYSHMDPLGLG